VAGSGLQRGLRKQKTQSRTRLLWVLD
jgi:hypothetical protein